MAARNHHFELKLVRKSGHKCCHSTLRIAKYGPVWLLVRARLGFTGIGKWVQNLAVVAVETILLSVLFLAVDVPEMLWTRHIEGEIAKEITQIVG
jgi:hypothetical protein